MLKQFVDGGIVLPIPNPWVPSLRVRLFRWDLDPTDKRVGLTLQVEW